MLKNINNLIKWCLWSKSSTYTENNKTKGGISMERMSLPKEISFLNLPNIELRISSMKAKFFLDLQNCIKQQDQTTYHIFWLEYLVFKDMETNKRHCPILALRNLKRTKSQNKWLEQAHLTFKDLPRSEEQLPKNGSEIVTLNKNAKTKRPKKGNLVRCYGDFAKIESRKKIFFRRIDYVYEEKIKPSHLLYNWDHSDTKLNSKLIYENSKNRSFLLSNKKDQELKKLFENNKRSLITDKIMIKNKQVFLTKGQVKHFGKYNIKSKNFNISKSCRENIYSFHTKLMMNCLPVFNKERKCELCKEKIDSGWHLLLECSKAQQIQMEALKTLKYEENKAIQKINDRKAVTLSGSRNIVVQNCTWTFNWAIWKFYNSVRHKQVKSFQPLSDVLLLWISIEEFRTINFFKSNQNLDLKKQEKNWRKNTFIYKLVGGEQPTIQLKKSNIIDNFYVL